MMTQGLKAQRLLALFVAGWLCLSFPLLSLFEGGGTWFGIPRLPAALFAWWAVLIGLLAWISERGGDE